MKSNCRLLSHKAKLARMIKANNMSILVTSTPSLEEQTHELQRRLAEKEAEITNLATRLENRDREKNNEADNSNIVITSQNIKELVAHRIKEHQAAMNPPMLGYRNPYTSHYDSIPFPKGYQKQNFEKVDGINGPPHEYLAYFYSACGETALNDALLIRQFVQSLKEATFTWYTQLQLGPLHTWHDLQRAFLA